MDFAEYQKKENAETLLWFALQILKGDPITNLTLALKQYKDNTKPEEEDFDEVIAYCNKLTESDPQMLVKLAGWLVESLPDTSKIEDVDTIMVRKGDLPVELQIKLDNFKGTCFKVGM